MASVDQSQAASADNTAFIILIACVATIGGFLFGFDSGVINGTIEGLRQAFNSSDYGTGFEVSSMLLGSAIGALAAGRLADFYGRRNMLILAAIFFIASAWGSGVSTGSVEFIIYRVLGGLAVGAASVMAPAYIAEVAHARYRGRLATVQQVAIITGLFAAFLSNYILAKVAGSSTTMFWWGYETWRWMFWIELIPAVIFLLALFAIPESPRFLVVKGRDQQALAVLTKLYGAKAGAQKQMDIQKSLASDHHRPRFSDLLDRGTGRVRRIVWIGIGLATFQQLVGINVVFYYGAVLWQSVGFSESDALLINVISGALSIGACLAAIALIDKIGRKPLLMIGSIGMSICLALMVVALSSGELINGQLQLSDNMGKLALLSVNAYVILFNFSWGPVMWVLLGEMFPNQIRGSALAVAGLAQWLANFVVTWSFPILLGGLGLAAAYSFYTLGAVISIAFVAKFVYETKGRELEDMKG